MKIARRGFIKSIPILCSYLFVGMAYGITMQNAALFEAVSYKWKHNTFLSIAVGTALYMVLQYGGLFS
mgnify:FL=1